MSGTPASKKRSKSGHLEKFSSKRVVRGFKPSWEAYYFQLVGGAYLQYFHKGKATKPHKQVYVSEIIRLELLDNWSDRQFCFRVCFTETGRLKAGEMMWTLAARSDEERCAWMEVIRPGSSSPSVRRMDAQQDTPAGRVTPPSPYRQSTMEGLTVGQPNQHAALSPRWSMGNMPPYYASTPTSYPSMHPHLPPYQTEQTEGPIPPLSPNELEKGSRAGSNVRDRSMNQSHYAFAVPDETRLGPSSLPGAAARQTSLRPGPERKLGARSSSPSGYTMMSSPSQEELHAMQSELRVMRSQSVSIHSPSQEELHAMQSELRVMRSQSVSIHSSSDSGSSSQEKHYSVPKNLPALEPHSDLSFKDASGHPSGHRERMPISPLDLQPVPELNPQLESAAELPTASGHKYSVLEEEEEYELPTPLEVMKGMAFLQMPEEVEGGPLSLLSRADEEEFHNTFSNALVSHCHITIGKEIGEGAFGRVYRGSVDGQDVAVKTIRSEEWAIGMRATVYLYLECDSKNELLGFLRESALMKDFHHPHVLGLTGVCLDNPTREPLILLPFMANGDLKTYLRTKREGSNDATTLPEGLDEQRLLMICEQIASGMAYLESRHFVHRDLAARNCMMDGDMGVKVADFGMARDMHSADYYRLTHKSRLPVKWMAPESFYDGKFTSKTDVWSFGVTCWEVFSLGRAPYPALEAVAIPKFLDSGKRMEKPSLCPESFYQLLLRCWDSSFSTRPSFGALVTAIEDMLERSNYMNYSVHQDQ